MFFIMPNKKTTLIKVSTQDISPASMWQKMDSNGAAFLIGVSM